MCCFSLQCSSHHRIYIKKAFLKYVDQEFECITKNFNCIAKKLFITGDTYLKINVDNLFANCLQIKKAFTKINS